MAEALRDYQHAHRFYTAMDFAHAPKVKFLYHVLFTLSPEGRSWSYAAQNHGKELSVLVKSADLPSYSAQIETKKQYNRIKNIQTRIDYDPVSIKFHDDNSHITSQLLEDYYTYYYRDGLKRKEDGSVKDYNPRDKYAEKVPFYGLDSTPAPFFANIKIFQLSKKEWRSYTLVNPMVEKWQHDTLDYSDGVGIMENSLSILYESVLYNEGKIDDNGDPAGFKDQQTMYDTTPSPIQGRWPGASITKAGVSNSRVPVQDTPTRNRPTANARASGSTYDEVPQQFPIAVDSEFTPTLNTNSVSSVNADTLPDRMEQPQNKSAKDAFTRRAVQTGAAGVSQEDYEALSEADKDKLGTALLDEAAKGDKKLQNFANDSLEGSDAKNKEPRPTRPLAIDTTAEEEFELNEVEKIRDQFKSGEVPSEEDNAYYQAHTVRVPGQRGRQTAAEIRANSRISKSRKAQALSKINRQRNSYNEQNFADEENAIASDTPVSNGDVAQEENAIASDTPVSNGDVAQEENAIASNDG
jgi:hypothetical protein